jgi:translation initiation factor 4G
MDEEDHEAICSMFGTIGATIDKPASADFMKVCFDKIQKLSTDSALPSRSRFMYKDLLELRQNQWVPRRKVEKAKTLEEIRKDVEREERKQAQQSQQAMRGSFRQSGSGGGRGGYDNRSQRQSLTQGGTNRPRQPKPSSETDADGFTTIGNSRAAPPPPRGNRGSVNSPKILTKSAFSALADDSTQPVSTTKSAPEPMSEEKLKRRVKSMRADFIGDGGNVDELILSMEELSGTPDAGTILVQSSADSMMDSKDTEREAIVKIISILAERGKISSEEVKNGLLDTIEFIDSFAMDAPRAFEYVGELLAPLLKIDTIDVDWICKQSETTKVEPNTKAPSRIVGETLKALAKLTGTEAAVEKFDASQSSVVQLLGSTDEWSSIKAHYLA